MKVDFNNFLWYLFLLSNSRILYYVNSGYIPYCNLKMECESSCRCESLDGCLLLPMNETSRNTILYYHNQIRALQTDNDPKPTGLAMLQYDMELEAISECWAVRCSQDYSECFRTSKFSETSQSVVQIIVDIGEIPTVVLWSQMKNYWQMQAKSIQAETMRSMPTGKQHMLIHNFAQIVSDRILYVGCSWSLMERLLTFACTYGPRGPNSGESIYKMGQTCSACPDNYECTNIEPFPLLCKKKSEKIMTSIVSPSLISKSEISVELDKVNREEKRGRYAPWKHFTEGLPRAAKTLSPYGLDSTDWSKLAKGSVHPKSIYTSKADSRFQWKQFYGSSSQLPLTRLQLQNGRVNEDIHLFNRVTYTIPYSLISEITDTENREEEKGRYASWKFFKQSSTAAANILSPYRPEVSDKYSSKDKTSVYPISIRTSQSESKVQYNDFPGQSPLANLHILNRKMKEDADSFKRITYPIPYSLSFTESLYRPNDEPKTSISSVQLNVNISFFFPREILTLQQVFQVTEAYKLPLLYSSVLPKFIPEAKNGDEQKKIITPLPSPDNSSAQKKHRLLPLPFTSTESTTYVFSSKKRIHDNMGLWRKSDVLDMSNNSREEKPSQKEYQSGSSIFVFLGIGILFLITGVFLVGFLMYILRMEAA